MPMVGDTLAGRYQIDAALGAGATAVVYQARDLRLDRDVAVKVLLPNLARDPLVAGRFDREARALAAASHPGIIAVYDVDRGDPATGREPFFVMELCEAGSLADALDGAAGRLPPDELVPMLADIAAGLASLHARGVIHRDVKPHNIMLCGGSAKLADFGLARAQDATRLSAPGTAAGTLAYLAPELLAGVEPSPASDLYALGVVAFQGLTGRLPRPAGSMVDLVDARRAPVAPASSVAPELGRAFDAPVAAALSLDPARRPAPLAFGAAMGRALAGWRAETRARPRPLGPARPTDSTQQVRLRPRATGQTFWERRGPWLAALALVVLLGLVAVALGLAGVLPRSATGPTPSPSASGAASPSAEAPSPTPTLTPSPTPAPSASVSPSVEPTPSPSPTPPPTATAPPTPVPTPVPVVDFQAAAQQLANLQTAIDSAQRLGNISAANAAELVRLTGPISTSIAAGDATSARQEVSQLADTVDAMLADGRLRNNQELRQTVVNLAHSLGLSL